MLSLYFDGSCRIIYKCNNTSIFLITSNLSYMQLVLKQIC